MTSIEEAVRRLDVLGRMVGDAEAAHSEEDRFRHEVLEAIRDGHPAPKALAAIALMTSELDFARWCA